MTAPLKHRRHAYVPRESSTAGRVLRFLSANPDEELTPRDVAVKFSVEYHSVGQGLNGAVWAGLIAKVQDDKRRITYRLPDKTERKGAE